MPVGSTDTTASTCRYVSTVELSDDTHLINYTLTDQVDGADCPRYVHVLTKPESGSGPFHWTAYIDRHPYGVGKPTTNPNASTNTDTNKAFIASMQRLASHQHSPVKTIPPEGARVRVVEADSLRSALQAIDGVVTTAFRSTPASSPNVAHGAPLPAIIDHSQPTGRRCRLLARQRWLALGDEDKHTLLQTQETDGPLLLTQPMEDLLLNKDHQVFYPIYRSVSRADSALMPRLCAPSAGHLMFVGPCKQPAAAQRGLRPAKPQLVNIEFDQMGVTEMQAEFDWLNTEANLQCLYDEASGVTHLVAAATSKAEAKEESALSTTSP